MKSGIKLVFKDPKDNNDFKLKRNREIISVSGLLLLWRFCFFLVVLFNYFLNSASVDSQRIYLNSIGLGIHMLALLPLYLGRTQFFQVLHAPLVILSCYTCMFNSVNVFTESQGSTLSVQQLLIVIVSIAVLSINWMLTSFVILLITVTNCRFMINTPDMYLGEALPQQLLMLGALSYICYFCENKHKGEFLQIKYNKKLKIDFKTVLEEVPEGLVIYDPK
jgi:hypothetical protein